MSATQITLLLCLATLSGCKVQPVASAASGAAFIKPKPGPIASQVAAFRNAADGRGRLGTPGGAPRHRPGALPRDPLRGGLHQRRAADREPLTGGALVLAS